MVSVGGIYKVLREPLNIYVGYDSRESVAYHVLCHSILRRSTIPVRITPVALLNLCNHYTRERGPLESTEFSMTRFLVPYLSDYKGYSVFMDSDMLCLVDMRELLVEIDMCPTAAVLVAKHEYIPKDSTKFLEQTQTVYPRKNWSSFMVFNNELCRALTPNYVNQASGLELHRFKWLADYEIGDLELTWNWLVGEYEPNPQAKVLHFTVGGPWFSDYRECDCADLWFREYYAMTDPINRERLV